MLLFKCLNGFSFVLISHEYNSGKGFDLAHLSFEYSQDLSKLLDLQELCDVLCNAMISMSYFPAGGIRVRGFAANISSIADQRAEYNFIDMVLRMGEGRSVEVRKLIAEDIYFRAEEFLKKQEIKSPLALSLEVLEIKKEFSIKRFNTIHGKMEKSD